MLAWWKVGQGKVAVGVGESVAATGGNHADICKRSFTLVEFSVLIEIEPDAASDATGADEAKVEC